MKITIKIMILIGETINSSIPIAKKLIDEGNFAGIAELAKKQEDAGANFIDVNAGMYLDKEAEILTKIIKAILPVTSLPISIDSANPDAVTAGIEACDKREIIINSISLEKKRFEGILPIAVKYNTKVIALPIDDKGIPELPEDRFSIAEKLIAALNENGISNDRIIVDAVITPVSVNHFNGKYAVDFIKMLKNKYPQIKTSCGLSNISFGLPSRKNLNRSFLIAAMSSGLDCAILDVLDKRLMSLLYAANVILGNDEYCAEYIGAFRNNMLE